MEHLKSIIYQQYIVDKQDLNMFLRINYFISLIVVWCLFGTIFNVLFTTI